MAVNLGAGLSASPRPFCLLSALELKEREMETIKEWWGKAVGLVSSYPVWAAAIIVALVAFYVLA